MRTASIGAVALLFVAVGFDHVLSAKVRTVAGGTAPLGFAFCANEGGVCRVEGIHDVAFGANGTFYYRRGVSGRIKCNDAAFGDPLYGVVKACYVIQSRQVASANPDRQRVLSLLSSAIQTKVNASSRPKAKSAASDIQSITGRAPKQFWINLKHCNDSNFQTWNPYKHPGAGGNNFAADDCYILALDAEAIVNPKVSTPGDTQDEWKSENATNFQISVIQSALLRACALPEGPETGNYCASLGDFLRYRDIQLAAAVYKYAPNCHDTYRGPTGPADRDVQIFHSADCVLGLASLYQARGDALDANNIYARVCVIPTAVTADGDVILDRCASHIGERDSRIISQNQAAEDAAAPATAQTQATAESQQSIQDKIDSLNNEIQQLESDAGDADQNADNLATNSNCTGGFGAYAQIAQQGCENINSIGVAKFRSEAAKDRNQADDDRAEIARLQGEEVQEAPHRDASFSGALAQQMQQNPQPSIVDTANQEAANMIAVGAANDAARHAEQQREQQAQQQAQPTEQTAPSQHVPDLPAGCITVSESDKEEANFGAWVFTNNCGVRVLIAVTAPPDPQVTGNPYDVYQNTSLDVGQSLRGPLANQRYKYFACPSPFAPYDSSTSSGHIVNPNFETNETVCLQVDASGDILAH